MAAWARARFPPRSPPQHARSTNWQVTGVLTGQPVGYRLDSFTTASPALGAEPSSWRGGSGGVSIFVESVHSLIGKHYLVLM